ncbi:MAG TPA: hypothetical protein VF322_15240 [Gammaproteobacteria bacterium]
MELSLPPHDRHRYRVPPRVLAALERVLGDGDLARVAVVYRPLYVRTHLWLIGARWGSVTRPEVIYTNLPEATFFALDAHVLHEYFHVVRHWRRERMTRTGYLLRCRRREREAREFVARNLEHYRAWLEAWDEPGEPCARPVDRGGAAP